MASSFHGLRFSYSYIVVVQVKHLAERLSAAQAKNKRLYRLEAALADFFMEIMEREPPNGEQYMPGEQESSFMRLKRKEQLLKRAEGDSISLLNTLRTHLRIQFSTQIDQQRTTTQSIRAIATRHEL